MNRLKVNLLGSSEAVWENGAPVAIPTKKASGLLAYVALSAPRGARRAALANLYWADTPESDARTSLRRTLHELTAALGSDSSRVLEIDRNHVALRDSEVVVDVLAFEAACRSGDLASLRLARKLYAGGFLASHHGDAQEFEAWRSTEASRLEDLAIGAFCSLAEKCLESGRLPEALNTANTLLDLDPLHEAGCRLAMRALAASGRRAEALHRYEVFRARLEQEFASAPELETVKLRDHIHRGQTMLPATPLRQPDAPSIVILPMRNLSGDDTHDFIADALTENLTAELSRDHSLFVIARNSALAYADRALSAPETAADLGVRYLLDGGIEFGKERLRVNVQLIDGADGGHVWVGRYDRQLTDFIDVQDEIVSEIVATLRGYKGAIQRAELRRSLTKPKFDLSAYENLMRGMAHKETFLREDMLIAREYFERAIAQSPDFAMAQGWLAWTWFFDVYMGWVDDPAPSLQNTFAAAQNAVRLDPGLDFAHWALGAAYLAAGDLANSLQAFDKALELNPNNSDALANGAWPLTFSGRPDEAVAQLDRAMRLNPYYPDWYLWGVGIAQYSRGEFRHAAAALEKMMQPNSQSHAFLAASLSHVGEIETARRAASELMALEPSFRLEQLSRSLPYTNSEVPEQLIQDLENIDGIFR